MTCGKKAYDEIKDLITDSPLAKILIVLVSIIVIPLFSYHLYLFIKLLDYPSLSYIIAEGIGTIIAILLIVTWIRIKCEKEKEEAPQEEKERAIAPRIPKNKETIEAKNPVSNEKINNKKNRKSEKLDTIDEESFDGKNPMKE